MPMEDWLQSPVERIPYTPWPPPPGAPTDDMRRRDRERRAADAVLATEKATSWAVGRWLWLQPADDATAPVLTVCRVRADKALDDHGRCYYCTEGQWWRYGEDDARGRARQVYYDEVVP